MSTRHAAKHFIGSVFPTTFTVAPVRFTIIIPILRINSEHLSHSQRQSREKPSFKPSMSMFLQEGEGSFHSGFNKERSMFLVTLKPPTSNISRGDLDSGEGKDSSQKTIQRSPRSSGPTPTKGLPARLAPERRCQLRIEKAAGSTWFLHFLAQAAWWVLCDQRERRGH